VPQEPGLVQASALARVVPASEQEPQPSALPVRVLALAQVLVLQQANARIQRKMEQQKASDMMNDLPLPGIVKRLLGRVEQEDEDKG